MLEVEIQRNPTFQHVHIYLYKVKHFYIIHGGLFLREEVLVYGNVLLESMYSACLMSIQVL